MKMKSAPIAVLALSVLATIMITPIHSATSYSYGVYGRTDKSSYIPGDSGILYLTIKNTGGGSFTVRNVTIEYPWKAFITDHWDGNFTTTGINQAVGTPGGTWNTQFSFTVPTDGRAYYGSTIAIMIGTDITNGNQQGIYTTGSPIVIALAAYQPLSLATSILPIISIVLIAAAVVMLALVYMGLRKQSKK
jgi:hypothetical protein